MVEEVDEKTIRRYLLGELAETEMARFEERLMDDDQLFETLLVVEDDLIDASAADELSAEERAHFNAHFLTTPQRHERLQLARTLYAYAARSDEPNPVVTPQGGASEPSKVAQSENTNGPAVKPAVKDDLSPTPDIRPAPWSSLRRYMAYAAAAVIVIALALVIRRMIPPASSSQGLQALNQAYLTQRPTEARITGLNYASPPPITRGSAPEQFDYVARDRAALLIQTAAADHPGASSYHDLGRLYLAKHEFDKAIDQFEKALALDGKNAQVHSDLGAAWMEQGKADRQRDESGKSLEEFAKALEHLNKAIELDGKLLGALFNRALCHQYLFLPQQAEEDWRAYLNKDSDSQWADEARRNLQSIEEQRKKISQSREQLYDDFLSAYPMRDDSKAWGAFRRARTRKGNFIIERIIDEYLRLGAQGKTGEAKTALRLLAYAGDLEARRGGDMSASHIAQFYLSTTPSQQGVLAQARALVKIADEQSIKTNYKKAIDAYRSAMQMFHGLGDNCEARYAEYRIAHCALRQTGASANLEKFERLAQTCEKNGHKWLLALTYSSLADAYNSIREHSKGLYYSTQALKIAEELDDTNSAVHNYLQVAIGYQKVRDYHKALGFIQRGLLLAGDYLSDLSLLWIICDVAAEGLKSLGFYAAALDYQRAALQLAVEMDSPLNLSRSYAHLGFIYGKLQNYDEGIRTAARAFEIGNQLSDEVSGREIVAYSSLYLGDLYRQVGDYDQALAYYDQNLNTFANLDFPLHIYASHKGRLLCYIAQGDQPAAKTELAITLRLFEQCRAKIKEENNRNSFFDIEQNVYDTAMDFEFSVLNDREAAFNQSEICRARSLLDLSDQDARIIQERFGPELALSANTPPLTLTEVKTDMPAQSQVVQYAVLEDKILVWVVASGTSASISEPAKRTDLEEKINRYLQQLSRPTGDLEAIARDGKDLYDLLISPIKGLLDSRKYLCIVPDKALNALPFDALISSVSGNYLVSDYTLGICPSSTLFIKRSETARRKEGVAAESALVVGNPRFDRGAFPELQELSSSEKEAEAVASFYQTSPLIGRNATERRVRADMPRSDVIHLAAHYVRDKRSYLLSAFLLAPEPDAATRNPEGDGLLQACELYALNLRRTRLVVLAGCQTGIERSYQGEGAISIARPFIAAGVPVVVTSLWPIDSEPTARLMIRFHELRKREGHSTAQALQLAQQEMLNSPDALLHHPYYWAAFAVIGGHATF